MAINGDSWDYEFLTEAVKLSANLSYPTIEIGVRGGLGSATIMDAIVEYCPGKTHIGIDPYGSILYPIKENVDPCRLDYTDDMYKQCMVDLFSHTIGKPVNFIHCKLRDSEYMNLFTEGYELNDLESMIVNHYSTVHFDGPHTVNAVMAEVIWFNVRTVSGSTFVFDDVNPDDFFYSHHIVHTWLIQHGWKHLKTGTKKALYQKI